MAGNSSWKVRGSPCLDFRHVITRTGAQNILLLEMSTARDTSTSGEFILEALNIRTGEAPQELEGSHRAATLCITGDNARGVPFYMKGLHPKKKCTYQNTGLENSLRPLRYCPRIDGSSPSMRNAYVSDGASTLVKAPCFSWARRFPGRGTAMP